MIPKYFAHPKALVEKGARIGAKTRIWAFAHVVADAEIGECCNICDNVFVEGGARLGNHVTVKNGVAVWEGVYAEDYVFIGPGAVFTNDRLPRTSISRSKSDWLLPTRLEHGCTIGANATVICGHVVGRFAFVAAGAVVITDVPDHAMFSGVPARFRSWVCKCGSKLLVKSGTAKCKRCKARYVRTSEGLKTDTTKQR